MGSMTDDQYAKMADSKLVLVRQKSYLVRTALHTMRGSVVMDPVRYAVLPVKEQVFWTCSEFERDHFR